MDVLILNGVNLGRLGRREPDVYGSLTHAELAASCREIADELALSADVRQTDSEAELIGWLHEAADAGIDVILNAAAWTHTSVAVRDACAQLSGRLVEVHLSNVYARESFRHTSMLSDIAAAVVAGMGVYGYHAALRFLAATARE